MSDVINAFPGYEYVRGKDGKYHNMYRGTDVGRGGYVYAEPGIYTNVALLDVKNMHGESIVRLNKFGENTRKFIEIREARNAIKAHDFDRARKMLDGKLAPMLEDESKADLLSDALKLICNSCYGIAAASFDNPLRDPRDKNNIIALRGALFMRTLQDEVVNRGFKVIAIRTDSIKIPNATQEIIDFCMEFGRKYGYEFEHECTYDRLCLVNDAVYIALYDNQGVRNKGGKHANQWSATGAQFQQPYVFKSLFSGEPITFDDLCETKSVSGGAIYLDMNEKLPDVSAYEKELEKIFRKWEFGYPELNRYIRNDEVPSYRPMEIVDWLDRAVELLDKMKNGHDYHFVGRVGQFTPIKPGLGGGLLVRGNDGKYSSVTGSKGFRWLESETIKAVGREDDVDMEYYYKQSDDAMLAIEKYGSFDRFIDTSRPYEDDRPKSKAIDISSESDAEPEDDDPPWNDLPPVVPCGDGKYNSCLECPNCKNDICSAGYSLAVNGGGAA